MTKINLFFLCILISMTSACIEPPPDSLEPDAGSDCVDAPEWTIVELVSSFGDVQSCPLQGFHMITPDGENLFERHLAPGCNFNGENSAGEVCQPYSSGSRFRLPYDRVIYSWCATHNESWDFVILDE